MLNCFLRALSSLLLAVGFSEFALARGVDRTLFLSTYSDDFVCSNIVYARIDNERCTDTSVCTMHNDSDGSFHDSEMTACILSRDDFLKSAFNGAAYLTIELYPKDCLGKSYNTRSFVADGKCHPYALNNHFRVVHNEAGTTSVLSAEAGCDSDEWIEEWSTVSATELNSEACLTDGVRTWKSYFDEGLVGDKPTDSTDSVVNSSTTAAPVATTTPPASTTAAPAINSTTLASSSQERSHSFGVLAIALLTSVVLLGTMFF